jgi:purine nucleosidase/pyrimidine-specific ribonucleoside hydrolase
MVKLIIDTDPGDDVDDVLALAFALLTPGLDIQAITTITTGADKRAQIVRKLLSIVGRSDIPVAPGIELPLRGLTDEELGRMTDNAGYVLNHYSAVKQEDVFMDTESMNAVELIIRTVEQNPGEITIASIGPLTNIALALRYKPTISAKIRSIAIMGGEVNLPRREHNIAWDPEAAEVVFTSGIPLFMGTWNVTRGFTLLPEHCERIRNHDSELCAFLTECIDLWWPFKAHKPGPVMYDIAPMLWSLDRNYYETEMMDIHIETRGLHTRGMTVVKGSKPNAAVTVGIKAEAIRELFLNTVCPR